MACHVILKKKAYYANILVKRNSSTKTGGNTCSFPIVQPFLKKKHDSFLIIREYLVPKERQLRE